jgi:tRNA threonylcarbamoyladenosine biosynthesis protein TsaE
VIRVATSSLAATQAVAASVAGLSRPGDLIVLAGEMGAGKTAFAQGFARALGVTEPVTSPTFTLVHSYDTGRTMLHHADLYRLDRMSEVADLALAELLEDDGVVLVEWGDAVAARLGEHLEVRLIWEHGTALDQRSIEMTATGRSWAMRWERLEAAMEEWTC